MTTHDTTSSIPAKRGSSALQMGPRKRASLSDPLVSHGRHFGRTVFALCNYPSLLTNGILRLEQMEDTPLEDFSAEERREHRVFEQLLDSYPGLLDRLKDGSDEEILHVGELIGKGAAGARGDDTKTLKSAVLDWISPKGEAIQPPLHRNSKIDRGFNHKLTGSLLCPAGLDWSDPQIKEDLRSGEMSVCGDQWPIFLYAHYVYDHEDPWSGLLRSRLLVCAYKHVFTSPSSVDREPKATRSGNARLHGMNCVTMASIAYIATQVRFALSSSSVFSRTDTTTDSETFYHSLLDLLEDPEESKEVDELLTWWNRQVFPTSSAAKRPISANSALSKIRQKRMALRQATNLHNISS
ncbi:hypothetical protein DEU56DRAFT_759593 [Suillus clintonianus]|uniref:uncharacterized protein n=1 Tax=Suillus clintonianus TaxID=1904413 RepID=UPI001B8668D1|nr:uncharacterized protein DEU56DRAFT_749300 [Suillus clintonianus]XP_041204237.1 uncharacterized protein DEU56DRAFT_759593 [Suillus clintonianus]KAG2112776.1 hypothetical protein DEU56DRAFT_749300 [Suillus clintonianus]KAG2124840.1 hypothetical protein DEU56DRAFT_759593 [Suillus clintonianus]